MNKLILGFYETTTDFRQLKIYMKKAKRKKNFLLD